MLDLYEIEPRSGFPTSDPNAVRSIRVKKEVNKGSIILRIAIGNEILKRERIQIGDPMVLGMVRNRAGKFGMVRAPAGKKGFVVTQYNHTGKFALIRACNAAAQCFPHLNGWTTVEYTVEDGGFVIDIPQAAAPVLSGAPTA